MTDETTARSVPTLDEIKHFLHHKVGCKRLCSICGFERVAHPDHSFTCEGATYSCSCGLDRFKNALESGAYALVSREDRESAITAAERAAECRMSSMRASYDGDRVAEDRADSRQASHAKEARSLLSLDAHQEK